MVLLVAGPCERHDHLGHNEINHEERCHENETDEVYSDGSWVSHVQQWLEDRRPTFRGHDLKQYDEHVPEVVEAGCVVVQLL